jgi:hypothetical protein
MTVGRTPTLPTGVNEDNHNINDEGWTFAEREQDETNPEGAERGEAIIKDLYEVLENHWSGIGGASRGNNTRARGRMLDLLGLKPNGSNRPSKGDNVAGRSQGQVS